MKKYYEIEGNKYQCGTMFCIGKNYAKHAAEMGGEIPKDPVVFFKPGSSYVPSGSEICLPTISKNVHYETELVIALAKDCKNIKKEDAADYIAGYAAGLDLTLRDIQAEAKEKGHPWAVAKGFAQSACVSPFVPQSRFDKEIPFFDLKLWVNGELKQQGYTGDMERSPALLLEYLSSVFELTEGDLIFTGTPEGVGKINHGDELTAELTGYVKLNIKII